MTAALDWCVRVSDIWPVPCFHLEAALQQVFTGDDVCDLSLI